MTPIVSALGPVGLPEGVTEESVQRAHFSPGAVTITSVAALPPRYSGVQPLPPFTPRSVAAPDEQYLSTSTGACGLVACPRTEWSTWHNDGSGWRLVERTVRP